MPKENEGGDGWMDGTLFDPAMRSPEIKCTNARVLTSHNQKAATFKRRGPPVYVRGARVLSGFLVAGPSSHRGVTCAPASVRVDQTCQVQIRPQADSAEEINRNDDKHRSAFSAASSNNDARIDFECNSEVFYALRALAP